MQTSSAIVTFFPKRGLVAMQIWTVLADFSVHYNFGSGNMTNSDKNLFNLIINTAIWLRAFFKI